MTRTYSFFIAGFITVISFSQEATNSSFFLGGGEASHKPASCLGNSLMSSSHSQNLQIPNDSQIVSAIAPKNLCCKSCVPPSDAPGPHFQRHHRYSQVEKRQRKRSSSAFLPIEEGSLPGLPVRLMEEMRRSPVEVGSLSRYL